MASDTGSSTGPSATPEKTVPAAEFCRSFGRFREEATAGHIVKVSAHGRVVGAFISAAELAHFEKLKRRERQAYRIEELPDALFDLMDKAEHGKLAE